MFELLDDSMYFIANESALLNWLYRIGVIDMSVGKRIYLKRQLPDPELIEAFKEIPASNLGSMEPGAN